MNPEWRGAAWARSGTVAAVTLRGRGPRGRGMNRYDHAMSVERLTVSLESELAADVREAAAADAQNTSAWLADAARRRLATRGLRDVIAEWEATHGAFTDRELADARARLGM